MALYTSFTHKFEVFYKMLLDLIRTSIDNPIVTLSLTYDFD